MAKPIKAKIKLAIEAGKATPAPPIGPVLAPHGINISDFCKQFNDATRDRQGWTIPAEITIYEDRTFEFVLKEPPASELIKKAIGVEKGSGKPNLQKVGKITRAQLKEIAKRKMPDLNTDDEDAAMRIIEGTAKNMGVEVVD